jgi:hypothetical protein
MMNQQMKRQPPHCRKEVLPVPRRKNPATGVGVAAVTANDRAMPLSESFQSIKQAQGRAAAIQYLKETGVTWKEDKHEGINWMRASMAANKAFM